MLKQSIFTRALPGLLLASALTALPGCGGNTTHTDTPRVATGSTNTQGLWRMKEQFATETFYSAAIVEGTGNNPTITDCSRAFEADKLTLNGDHYDGFDYDMAPLNIVNNDAMTWNYNNQTRSFQKMDENAQFNMGTFTLTSTLLPSVVASKLVCTQYSTGDKGESLVLTTRVLGKPLLITIRMKDGFKVGTFNISPYGDQPAMVIFSGPYWATTTLLAYDDIASGTLTIKERGKVWITGNLSGQLLHGKKSVSVNFDVETPAD